MQNIVRGLFAVEGGKVDIASHNIVKLVEQWIGKVFAKFVVAK